MRTTNNDSENYRISRACAIFLSIIRSKKVFGLIVLVILIPLLTACGTYPYISKPQYLGKNPKKLSGAEIEKYFFGKVMNGKVDLEYFSTDFRYGYYNPDNLDDTPQGGYSIKNDQLCAAIDFSFGCWDVYKLGNSYRFDISSPHQICEGGCMSASYSVKKRSKYQYLSGDTASRDSEAVN